MSALVYVILALGYLHSTEAYEELNLSDFLLDFLLSLWVPSDYTPSNEVQDVTDPKVREQLISVEKSRHALDNYIAHLLRYATENANNGFDYNNQNDVMDDLNIDSSQIYNNNQMPLICNPTNYVCEVPNIESNPPPPYPILTPQPYPSFIPGFPVDLGNPTLGPLPNLGMIPNEQYEANHQHGYKYIQYLHNHHNHHEHHHPHHPHHHHHHHHENAPNMDYTNNGYFPQWSLGNEADSPPTVFPDIIGQPPNIFTAGNEETNPICDPKINPLLYNPNYCGSVEMVPPAYLYQTKRNTQTLNKGLVTVQRPSVLRAQRYSNLAGNIKPASDLTATRILEKKPKDQKKVTEDLVPSLGDSNKKNKRENNIGSNDPKDISTRIFEDWYVPNFLSEMISRPYRHQFEPNPTAMSYNGYMPQYSNNPYNNYNGFTGNRILSKKKHPKETLFRLADDDKHHAIRIEDIPWLTLKQKTTPKINKDEKHTLIRRSVFPRQTKTIS